MAVSTRRVLVLSCAVALLAVSANLEAQINGTSNKGMLPIHIYTLRIPPGGCPHPNPAITGCRTNGDTLPVGPDIYYMFAIFDTGSTMVTIGSAPEGNADDNILRLCSLTQGCVKGDPFLPPSLDLRVWGPDAVDPVNLGAPLDFPEAEVKALRIRAGEDLTLMGAPLASKVAVYIDFTTLVTRVYSFGTLRSMDMTFFGPAAIPVNITPLFEAPLFRGPVPAVPTDGATVGARYFHEGLVFQKGTLTAKGGAADFDIMFDTGTTSTMISTEVADALGINWHAAGDTTLCLGGSGPLCTGGEILNGYRIDAFRLRAKSNSHDYQVLNPVVFVRPPLTPGAPPRTAFGGAADGIVGMNYLEKTKVLFNGSTNTLGFYVGVPVAAGSGQIPGDVNQDGKLDISDGIWLLDHLFLGNKRTLPCQGSRASNPQPGDLALADATGDGRIDLSDPVRIFSQLFLGGKPHALGRSCVRISGCRNVCSP